MPKQIMPHRQAIHIDTTHMTPKQASEAVAELQAASAVGDSSLVSIITIDTPIKTYKMSIPAHLSIPRFEAALQAFERVLWETINVEATATDDLLPFTEEAALRNVEVTEKFHGAAPEDALVPMPVPEADPETLEVVHAVEGIGQPDVKTLEELTDLEEDSDTPAPQATWPFPNPKSPTSSFDDPEDVPVPEQAVRPDNYYVSLVPPAFTKDLEQLINQHSLENLFDMPDFIIAEMVCLQLSAVANAIGRTIIWKT